MIKKICCLIVITTLVVCCKDKSNTLLEQVPAKANIQKGNYDTESYEYVKIPSKTWEFTKPDIMFLKETIPEHRLMEDLLFFSNQQDSTSIAKGNINRKKGTQIYKSQNFGSSIIATIPQGAPVNIKEISKKFKQYKTQNNELLNGRWVKVTYNMPNGEEISGYILDYFINYYEDISEFAQVNDTVIVKNEKEFLAALSSHRLIEIEADTLRFDTYFCFPCRG